MIYDLTCGDKHSSTLLFTLLFTLRFTPRTEFKINLVPISVFWTGPEVTEEDDTYRRRRAGDQTEQQLELGIQPVTF